MTRAWRRLDPWQRFLDFIGQCRWRGDCLEWTGRRNSQGYGRFYNGVKTEAAHRVAWSWTYGTIPSKRCVLHTCDNPSCVNLDHLCLGTYSDNTQDAVRKRRHRNSKKTHCKRGHAFTARNTYLDAGARRCRVCTLARNRLYYHQRLRGNR